MPSAARSPSDPASRPLRIGAVEPAVLDELGDQTLHVTLDGWTRGEPLPAISVDGAPLLEPRASGPSRVSGTTMANAPGPAQLVVQTARGCAFRDAAVELRAARLRLLPGAPPRLRFEARPGDRVEVFVSERWQVPPRLAGPNAVHLDEASTFPASWTLVAGPDSSAERAVPEGAALLERGACVQGVVLPAGLDADERARTRVKRWLAPLGAAPDAEPAAGR